MTKAAAKKKAPAAEALRADAELPDQAAIEALLRPVRSFAVLPGRERLRGFFARLADKPPQVLLLEGGNANDRLDAAHYFALLLNCEGTAGRAQPAAALPGLPGLPQPTAPACEEAHSRPCFTCPACARMICHLHRDCFFLDGVAGSIKIDDVRALRSVLGEPPREARQRIVIFREAQSLMEAAANALLKAFEEPRPGTTFMLLTPQRERLLPTLVSRSFCLTLPWPVNDGPDGGADGSTDNGTDGDTAHLAAWEGTLTTFMAEGRGLFERTGVKGAVDAALVHALLGLCSRALARCLLARQGHGSADKGLAAQFARLPDPRLRMVDEALAECRDSLNHTVNPALVLEWLATRLFLLVPRSRGR